MATQHTEAAGDSGVTIAVDPATRDAEVEVEVGRTLGRYAVLELLGRGGMGVVLRAYDPKLRREVALKVVRSGGRDSTEAEARLLREAQALARLSHPNVVAVFDAETTDRGVAIAMEYVEGRTLRAWLQERARSWQDVVDIALPIASGIAAAHAAGLVHRDVKPENVLVGNDGRVRVSDFGLARGLDGVKSDPRLGVETDRLGDTLTQAGQLVGTPAYIAPEQYEGAAPDARADQYALCVLLYEAVHGVRPFTGRELTALATSKRAGPPARPPTAIPAWLHDAIVRGLAPNPDERWPSVDALRQALASGVRRGRRRRIVLALGGVLALVGAGAIGRDLERRAARSACVAEAIEFVDDVARDDVHAAMAESTALDAADTAERVLPRIDDYARALQTARSEVCLDANVRDDAAWDADTVERAYWCLDERKSDLVALTDALRRGDARAMTHAVEAVASLGPLEPCRDAGWLARLPLPGASDRDAVAAIVAELSRVRAASWTGAYEDGLAHAREAREHAVALGWPPLSARARLQVGRLLDHTGAYEEAATELEAAYFEAAEAGVTDLTADAAVALAFTVGVHLDRYEEGLQWTRHAEMALEHLPDPTGVYRAHLVDIVASVYLSMGSHERAKQEYERALALIEASRGSENASYAATLGNLAIAANELGERGEARAALERAVAIEEKAYGPRHPRVTQTRNNLGIVLLDMGAFEEAREQLELTLRIRREVLSNTHPDVAGTLTNLGNLHYTLGEYEQAREHYAEALAIEEHVRAPDHVDIGRCVHSLANAYEALGQRDEARRLFERALTILTRALGPDSLELAGSLASMGSLAYNAGDYAEARERYERALAIIVRAVGPEYPHTAQVVVALAHVALAEGRTRDAVQLGERGLGLRERGEASPSELALARFVLARALVADGGVSTRALELAERARDGFRESPGPKAAREAERVEAWLREHALPTGD